MTKKEQEELVKRVSLKWRLSDKPTLKDVTVMLEKEIITKEEAKDMLFNEEVEEKTDKKIEALKEQIKFLQAVIESLSSKSHDTVTYIPAYPTYWYWPTHRPYWVNSTSGTTYGTATLNTGSLGSSGSTTYSVNTQNLIR